MDRNLDVSKFPDLPENYRWEAFVNAGSLESVTIKLKKRISPFFATVAKGEADFDGNDDSYVISKAMEMKKSLFPEK